MLNLIAQLKQLEELSVGTYLPHKENAEAADESTYHRIANNMNKLQRLRVRNFHVHMFTLRIEIGYVGGGRSN